MITFKQYILESNKKLKTGMFKDRDDSKRWYVNGELHRLDGPAVEYADGDKAWYVNGKRHRLDAPAVEYADGDKAWYVNGNLMSEEQFNKWRWKYSQSELLKKASDEAGIEMDI